MKFTDKQIENWKEFESVRAGGLFNMLSPEACAATSLTADEYMFCIKNYSALQQAAQGGDTNG